jgi:hypothetical protein
VVADTPVKDIAGLVEAANDAFDSGVTLPLAWRKKQASQPASSCVCAYFSWTLSELYATACMSVAHADPRSSSWIPAQNAQQLREEKLKVLFSR